MARLRTGNLIEILILQLTATFLTLFGHIDQVSPSATLLTLPIAAWEFSVGVYMLVKGFRSTPLTSPAI